MNSLVRSLEAHLLTVIEHALIEAEPHIIESIEQHVALFFTNITSSIARARQKLMPGGSGGGIGNTPRHSYDNTKRYD